MLTRLKLAWICLPEMQFQCRYTLYIIVNLNNLLFVILYIKVKGELSLVVFILVFMVWGGVRVSWRVGVMLEMDCIDHREAKTPKLKQRKSDLVT